MRMHQESCFNRQLVWNYGEGAEADGIMSRMHRIRPLPILVFSMQSHLKLS